jgi:hypothetical protein
MARPLIREGMVTDTRMRADAAQLCGQTERFQPGDVSRRKNAS